MAGKEDDKPDHFEQVAGGLSLIQNVFLPLAGLMYVTGLIVWSIYAVREGIVIERVIDAQYLVAGLLPGLSLAFAYYIYRHVTHLSRWVIPVPVIWTIAMMFFLFFILDKPQPEIFGSILLANILIAALVTLTPPSAALVHKLAVQRSVRTVEKLEAVTNYLVIVAVYLLIYPIFFVGYASAVYPEIPQALGGARPRCAIVNLTEDRIKALFYMSDQDRLLAGVQKEGIYPVELVVLHASNEVIYLRPWYGGVTHSPFTYEFQRDAFESIAWCNERARAVIEHQNRRDMPERG